jgi:hypothetical protein
MKISFKFIFSSILILALMSLAGYLGYRFSFVQKHSEIKQEVLLEKVQHVVKLGTVEGVFSEIFNYSDYYSYNISPLRKKALIRIRAKVLVGFNLDSMDYDIQYLNQKIVIRELPEPEIISIDHEMDYYDITEGYFNSFTKEDHNMLQKQSKDFIRKKALESDLFDTANKQLQQNLDMLNWALQEGGWVLEVKEKKEKPFWN